VGIAMSAGGLRPLRQLLTRLPETFPAAIVVVQHVGRFSNLPTILRPSLPFPVKFAEPDEPLRSATVYVSPPARHIVVNPHRTIGLSDAARVRCQRPSADWFFRSMADSFQGHGIGVMLSGALDDGARGIRFVHRAGGIVIVQDPRTSVHAGMPLAAIATGVVDHVLPPEAIGPALSALISTADRQRAAREWAEPFASV
jgi:two-component system chemotaxis response regulator CheB